MALIVKTRVPTPRPYASINVRRTPLLLTDRAAARQVQRTTPMMSYGSSIKTSCLNSGRTHGEVTAEQMIEIRHGYVCARVRARAIHRALRAPPRLLSEQRETRWKGRAFSLSTSRQFCVYVYLLHNRAKRIAKFWIKYIFLYLYASYTRIHYKIDILQRERS